MAKLVCGTFKTLSRKVLPHVANLPDLALSDYHLFALMGHALAEQRFSSFKDVKKWPNEGFMAKGEDFYWHGIH